MTQIMLEVGSNSLAPVRSAIESALADLGYTIEVLKTEDSIPTGASQPLAMRIMATRASPPRTSISGGSVMRCSSLEEAQ
jgi:hypothetical protein